MTTTGTRRPDGAAYADLTGLMSLMTGDEKHGPAATSTLDVLWVLYDRVLRVGPDTAGAPDRDRFLLSKGHGPMAYYAVLAAKGFVPVEWLTSFGTFDSPLGYHPDRTLVPGVEIGSGSLGHGLSVATGMALSAKKRKASHRAFVLMSDGECDEGSNWEAFLFAAHHKLDNLVAIVDYNKLQSLRSVNDTLRLEPLRDKLVACNWAVEEIDGHDHAALAGRLSRVPFETGKPSLLIAHTTKGRGVSFMENSVLWHYRTPQGDEYAAAVAELEKARPRS